MSEAISLVFAPPSPDLAPFVSTFYLFRTDLPRIEDVDRADVAQIRFMLKGAGEFTFANGAVEPSCEVMINGPGTGAAAYQVDGPFHCFGIALRPLGWGAFVDRPANLCADHAIDGAAMWGTGACEVLRRLRGCGSIEAMIGIAEPFLLAARRPVAPDHAALIDHVRRWISAPRIAPVEDMLAGLDFSERHVVRLVNRYFGAGPKLLARKMRALRAAACLVEGRPIDAGLADQFYDQPHMIREIRHFTGKTPGQLRKVVEPILRTTLHTDHFRELDAADA